MLTPEQTRSILDKIESLRGLEGKKALRKNDAIFKFLNALNAFGFIDSDEFNSLQDLRFEALMKIRRYS